MFQRGIVLFVSMLLSSQLFGQISDPINIIPQPASVKVLEGSFSLNGKTRIMSTAAFLPVAKLLSSQPYITHRSVYVSSNATTAANTISFKTLKTKGDSTAYRLHITPDHITIYARSAQGALYGMQSLQQIILTRNDVTAIPAVDIQDSARFSYRGMHLDVSRNFFPVAEVKKLLEVMSLYKLNTFHWHLVDGAGWRLDIKKYPELTKHAAFRTQNTHADWRKTRPSRYSEEGRASAYGGYYTQQQAREVVAYAKELGITVIPEIEMPGHSEEVLAVYPHLSCSGIPYTNGDFCIGNDSTFTFLEDVLTEVMDIFPSKYIHIGGDEASKRAWKTCPKCKKRMDTEHLKDVDELQSYAVKRMEKFLVKNKRKLLGWDEILEGGLAPEATVMSWRGEKGGIEAAKQGHDVIMTPENFLYFDHPQAELSKQPKGFGPHLPLRKVYFYEPQPAELTADEAKHVLGAQANTWTEYIPTSEHLEYMMFPRVFAVAELNWTQKELKNWPSFQKRLRAHAGMLQRMFINYCRPSNAVEFETQVDKAAQTISVRMESEHYQPQIRYTLDGSTPTMQSPLYTGPVPVKGHAVVAAAIFEDTLALSEPSTIDINFHKAIGKKVTYNAPYSKKYHAQDDSTLTNGYTGNYSYSDGQWQGFDGKDGIDVTIDLGTTQNVNKVSMRFMQMIGVGIYMPGSIEILTSNDGVNFTSAATIQNDVPATRDVPEVKTYSTTLNNVQTRYLRVVAKNVQRGFLFTDEITVD
ncbi:hexosaminidase [Chitinophaga skermanii]|uniref:beta-N-acetylhexosaminidase n=1 Tax=Chitinophaga skermanii TaxID=331697 RepID=A0A327R5N7_9BACT|nr:family 20 glycosylhydrolase [Chitinophaga skermanii]RAJ10903.1 hexosaminidase [Chitinophaga skermanii]